MYAFNHRFSPTVYFGVTMPTMIAVAGGVILCVLALAAVAQAGLWIIAMVLAPMGFTSIGWAIYNQSTLKTARYKRLLISGKFDNRCKSLELIKNR